MPNQNLNTAIQIKNIKKSYTLYPNPAAMALDLFGMKWLYGKASTKWKIHQALDGLSVEIKRSERVGIIGRNGAGKTTLLKLITGNYSPTSGEIQVNGKIQSLMDAGLGFHHEFTGIENVKASLIYNGLNASDFESAISDILKFAELGEYINYPLKTYSQGMAARLAFATATAVKPDILIVDEVLGAGDAYFTAKSAARMKGLTSSGATLLLVSHSNQQILEFCQRAIWIEQGKIVADGEALEVIKSYDKFIRQLDENRLRGEKEVQIFEATKSATSRWIGEEGLKITDVQLIDKSGNEKFVYESGESLGFEVTIQAAKSGVYKFRPHINIYSIAGTNISMHLGDEITVSLCEYQVFKVTLKYNELFLGNGEYVVTAGIYKYFDYKEPNASKIYDLLDRSFRFKVDSIVKTDTNLIYHPATWSTNP